VARRSAVINRYDRITGDAVEFAAARLIRSRRSLGHDALHAVIEGLVGHQDRRLPPAGSAAAQRPESAAAQRVLGALLEVVADYRHGL
jgi:inactivated superfamily I helicase